MSNRRTGLKHPTAGTVELPLLVPSFSSKGFPFLPSSKSRPHDVSEVAYVLNEFAPHAASSVLVSAYDLHFRHFEDAPEIPSGTTLSRLRNSQLVFVDSGGYELSGDFDSTEPKTPQHTPKAGFGKDEYEAVLWKLKKEEPSIAWVVSNFDHAMRGLSLQDQIADAREFFAKYPDCLSNFIVKPWTGEKGQGLLTFRDLSIKDFHNLDGFDVIGVTEKELGRSLWDRLQAVVLLRYELDRAGVSAPIHIWGGLDPVITPLFYFAGADIFDGISWLRYAYHNGVAVCRESFGVLHREVGVKKKRQFVNSYAFMSNLSVLENLGDSLQEWRSLEGGSFDMFHETVQDHLARAYRDIREKMRKIREVK